MFENRYLKRRQQQKRSQFETTSVAPVINLDYIIDTSFFTALKQNKAQRTTGVSGLEENDNFRFLLQAKPSKWKKNSFCRFWYLGLTLSPVVKHEQTELWLDGLRMRPGIQAGMAVNLGMCARSSLVQQPCLTIRVEQNG